jgi:uncharacterized membrane protein
VHGRRPTAATCSVVVAYMLTRDERLGRRIAGLVDVEVTG